MFLISYWEHVKPVVICACAHQPKMGNVFKPGKHLLSVKSQGKRNCSAMVEIKTTLNTVGNG